MTGCREVPVPRVEPEERYLITSLDYSGFYRCVARYGCAFALGSLLPLIAAAVPIIRSAAAL